MADAFDFEASRQLGVDVQTAQRLRAQGALVTTTSGRISTRAVSATPVSAVSSLRLDLPSNPWNAPVGPTGSPGGTMVPFAPPRLPGGIVGTVIGAVGGEVIRRVGGWLGGGNNPAPPGGPALPPPPPRTPVPGIGGWAQRTLPGGRTGYTNTPVDVENFAPIVEPQQTARLVAPPGYVIVNYQGQKVAMLKVLARKYGFWKPRPKPPVNGWDLKAIRRADRAQKRVKKLAGTVGFTCKAKGKR